MGSKVAIYDSGIGGLSLFKYFLTFKNISLTYLADNKYFPYGNKDEKELINIVERVLQYLTKEHDIVIIACNTASVIFKKYLSKSFIGVYNIIDYTVENVLSHNEIQTIGLIGTENTVKSRVYEEALLKKGSYDFFSKEASDLIRYCELMDFTQINQYIKKELRIFKEKEIELLILGCTHFNFLKPYLEKYFEGKVIIVPSGFSLVESLVHKIKIENNANKLYLTAKDEKYLKKVIKFLKINNNF